MKNIMDFWNCDFRFQYRKFSFKINEFSIDMTDHNCIAENIFNDWITIFFDKEIDVDKYKVQDIYKIEYSKEDSVLYINDDMYKVEQYDFGYFVSDFRGDLNQCMENIMQYFCNWFTKHLDEF